MRTIYCKMNERYIPEFCLTTQIVADSDGNRRVYKLASDERARQHVVDLKTAADRLPEILSSEVDICPCGIEDGKAVFPYIEGKSMLSRLQEATNGGAQRYTEAWQRFLDYLKPARTVPFRATEAFSALFGDGAAFEGCEAYPACAVDLMPANMLLPAGGKPVLFDYEWWISGPVPVELIKYHAIQTTCEFHPEVRHPDADLPGLFKACGLSEASVERCREAMAFFYRHISGEDRQYADCNHTERYIRQGATVDEEIRRLTDGWSAAAAYGKALEEQVGKDRQSINELQAGWEAAAKYARELESQIEKDKQNANELSEGWQAAAKYAEELEAQLEKDRESIKTLSEGWEACRTYSEELEDQLKQEQERHAESVENWRASIAYSKELEGHLNNLREYAESTEKRLQAVLENNRALEKRLGECVASCEELLKNWKSAAAYADALSEEKEKEKKEYEQKIKQIKAELFEAKYELDNVVNSFRWKMTHPFDGMKHTADDDGPKDSGR